MKRLFLFCLALMFFVSAGATANAQELAQGKYKFPWIVWGEIWNDSLGPERVREGTVGMFHLKQGWDVAKIDENWTVEIFGGGRLTLSSRDQDHWNNNFKPFVGVQLRTDWGMGDRGWGTVAVGVRSEYVQYWDGRDGAFRGIVYVSFSAGGREGIWKSQ